MLSRTHVNKLHYFLIILKFYNKQIAKRSFLLEKNKFFFGAV